MAMCSGQVANDFVDDIGLRTEKLWIFKAGPFFRLAYHCLMANANRKGSAVITFSSGDLRC